MQLESTLTPHIVSECVQRIAFVPWYTRVRVAKSVLTPLRCVTMVTKVAEEHDALKQQVIELKQRCDGLRARNTTLSREIKTVKDKLSSATREAQEEHRIAESLKVFCCECVCVRGLFKRQT